MLLSVKNLSTEFPVKKGIVKAVEDVSFDVDAGEILAIVGESGSGKSVTSLSIMGLLAEPGHVAGGSLEFEGKDLATLSEKQYRELRGNDMAMIFQEPMTSLNPVYRCLLYTSLLVSRGHFGFMAEVALALLALLRHDVALERLRAHDLAGTGNAESLRGAAMSLHLRHGRSLLLSSRSLSFSSPRLPQAAGR